MDPGHETGRQGPPWQQRDPVTATVKGLPEDPPCPNRAKPGRRPRRDNDASIPHITVTTKGQAAGSAHRERQPGRRATVTAWRLRTTVWRVITSRDADERGKAARAPERVQGPAEDAAQMGRLAPSHATPPASLATPRPRCLPTRDIAGRCWLEATLSSGRRSGHVRTTSQSSKADP
jgi:hypothetical protein